MSKSETDRRHFIQCASTLIFGSVIASTCGKLDPITDVLEADEILIISGRATLEFSRFPNLRNVGSSSQFRIDGIKDRLIAVRLSDAEFTVLSRICTHRQCTVAYDGIENTMACPCHGSEYDVNGNVINGPASRPLKKYQVDYRSGDDFMNIVFSN